MNLRSGWHKQAADGSDDLRSSEYGFSAEILRKNTADHLREYVTPVKGAKNGRLNGWAPRKLASFLSIRMTKQLYDIVYENQMT